MAVFTVDEDADLLTLVWTVDGNDVTGGANGTLEPRSLSLGTHLVVATVSDGIDTASASWSLVVVNTAPFIDEQDPARANDTAVPQTLRVLASDVDGDGLSYRWSVDGVASTGQGAAFVTPPGLPPGPHNVSVSVVDDLGAASQAHWTFNVPAAPASTIGGDMGVYL